MKLKKVLSLTLASTMLVASLVGCSTKTDESTSSATNEGTSSESNEDTISGEITVLTHRTDLVDSSFLEYAERFNEQYPDVTVKFEGITDYEGQTKIRMNTTDYGDVLIIPGIAISSLPDFFEPLGTVEEVNEKYYATDKVYDGIVYGIPTGLNALGIVYNKAVFEEAGITELPGTPEEFIETLHMIKDNTDAIPLYTNYAAGWTLSSWEYYTRSIGGNPNFLDDILEKDEIFTEGSEHDVVYRLLYDVVAEGLVERDPFTTDWELSKQMMADGEIATMALGSWAVPQVKELAENPEDIGYMPFPYTAADGKVYAQLGEDYAMGINVHSKNKEAARAWVDFFLEESGYAEDEGIIPPAKGAALPEDLVAFEELGVEFFIAEPESNPGYFSDIDREGEVGFDEPMFKQRMVESAIGNTSETFEDICDELNEKWQYGKSRVQQ